MDYQPLPADLSAFASEHMSRLRVPGVSLAAWHGGQEYAGGFGVTSVDNPLPVATDTLFQIGSTSKTVCATAMMRLVEAGKLDIHAPVQQYLPGFTVESAADAEQARVWHLVTHTAGWVGDYFRDTGNGDDAIEKIVATMAKSPQLTPLGETFSYNNASFYVAGRIVEVVTGKQYEAAIRELVLEPLGMSASFFSGDDLMTRRCAIGHLVMPGGPQTTTPWRLSRSAAPAGGIVSNVHDQMVYARFHLGDGAATDGTPLLSADSLAFMQRPLAKAGSMCDEVGFSWLLRDYGGVRIVQHGGATNGQMSAFAMVPGRDFAVTVLTNADAGRELHGLIVNEALRLFLGVSEPEPALLQMAPGELGEYAATYIPIGSEHEITVREGKLVLQSRPTASALSDGRLVPPAPPPMRLGFYDADRVVALDPPSKGAHGEFLRNADGSIAWFRWGGRVARRQGA